MSLVRPMVAAALLAGCGGGTAAPAAPVGNKAPSAEEAMVAAPVDGMADGALWTCQISDYDPQPCRLDRTDGGWYLRKLLGSQRFKGTVVFAGDKAFDFAGTYFCPWGDCSAPLNARFTRGSDGGYTAQTSGDIIRVAWDAKLASEWGGAGYGGLSGEER